MAAIKVDIFNEKLNSELSAFFSPFDRSPSPSWWSKCLANCCDSCFLAMAGNSNEATVAPLWRSWSPRSRRRSTMPTTMRIRCGLADYHYHRNDVAMSHMSFWSPNCCWSEGWAAAGFSYSWSTLSSCCCCRIVGSSCGNCSHPDLYDAIMKMKREMF